MSGSALRNKRANLLLLEVLGCIAVINPVQAVTIDLVPSSQEVMVGKDITIEVVIDGLEENISPSLGSFDLDLSFDPNILQFSEVMFCNSVALFGLGVNGVDDSQVASGIINFFEFSLNFPEELNNNQPDSFSLATVTFQSVGTGENSLVSISAINDLSNENFESLLPLDADPSSSSITVTNITRTTVPEPSVSLAVLGLFLALGTIFPSKSAR